MVLPKPKEKGNGLSSSNIGKWDYNKINGLTVSYNGLMETTIIKKWTK